MTLPQKQWDNMTEDEQRQWCDAAREKGPHLFGGATLTGSQFHKQIQREQLRREMRDARY